MSSNDPNANCKSITESFFKTAIVRGNQALFRNKDLQRAIYTRTRLKKEILARSIKRKCGSVQKKKEKYNKLL